MSITPYELRFRIFEQAQCLADSKYQADYATVAMWNDNPKNSVMMEYPDYPTFEYIQDLAEKINLFVSSNK